MKNLTQSSNAVPGGAVGIPAAKPPNGNQSQFVVGQTYRLVDRANQHVGDVLLETYQEGLWDGSFQEGAAFASHQPLFDAYLQLVNDQVFSLIDDVEARIDALGLRLESLQSQRMPPIANVEIGCGTMGFRVKDRA